MYTNTSTFCFSDELSDLRTAAKEFPEWMSESTIKPALQAMEISFRLVSLVLSDPRPYSDVREWNRRLGSLCSSQIEIISLLLEQTENVTGIPVVERSLTSEASLLPRLAAWDKSSGLALHISLQIESLMHRCKFTLGLGEPNLDGKPSLEYDLIVRPASLHDLENGHQYENRDNDVVFTIQHMSKSWLCTCNGLLREILAKIQREDWEQAASDCWILERIWKILSEIEDLHMMMDPDDFLRLKSQLAAAASSSSASTNPFPFGSAALLGVADMSRNLKNNVPKILAVEVDPKGGPRVQEAAMRLFHSSERGRGDNPGRLHLLQALQAVEAAVRRFFFGHRQLLTTLVGSLEARGNRGLMGVEASHMFMEPPYFPSLDAAKTFLGDHWQRESNKNCSLKQ